jgi:DNA-binding FrmR family transcriptional regulator
MTQTSTIQRVRNYQGDNSFVIKMKESLNKWGRLTEKQLAAVEKALNSVSVEVKIEELPEGLRKIAEYNGDNGFVQDMAIILKKYGTLTERQMEAALRQIEKETDKSKTVTMNWNATGETIKIGRTIGERLKEAHGLKFNPILIDITKVLAVSPKAIRFAGKLTVKRGRVCSVCARTLTDELSMLSNVGKTCSSHVGLPYLTDKSQAEQYRQEYLKRVEEIGEMEFWAPKSQIKVWDGRMATIVKTI